MIGRSGHCSSKNDHAAFELCSAELAAEWPEDRPERRGKAGKRPRRTTAFSRLHFTAAAPVLPSMTANMNKVTLAAADGLQDYWPACTLHMLSAGQTTALQFILLT